MTQPMVLVFENKMTLGNYFLKFWHARAQAAVHARGQFTMALSGGQTPVEFYIRMSSLSEYELWAQTHIFQTDERFVAASDRLNNFKMMREHLLDYVNVPQENYHAMGTDYADVCSAALDYHKKLKVFFAPAIPIMDLMILGVGTDGHVASLPDASWCKPSGTAYAMDVQTLVFQQARLSLSMSVINQSRDIVVLAVGAHKAAILKRILKDKDDILAATQVRPVNGQIIYLLDKDAARQLDYLNGSYTHEGQAVRPVLSTAF